jgi:hypothetical protein
MIYFNCTKCNTKLSAPPGSEGGQCDCPTCNTRLDIPGAAPAPRERARNYADEDRPSSRRKPAEDYEEEERPSRRRQERYDPPARREDYDDRPSRRRRDEEEDDRPSRRRRGGFECPYCGSDEPPATRSQMSQGGLVVLIIMLLLCWPLFWIGLLMKEEYQVCADCGRRL